MDKPISQKKFLMPAKITLAAVLVLSAALLVLLAYLTTLASTNVDFKIDYLLDVIDFSVLAVNLLVFAVTYSILIYSLFFFELKKIRFMIASVMIMPIIKNAANLLTDWYTSGVPAYKDDIFSQLFAAGTYAVSEILQHLIVILIITAIIKKAKKAFEIKQKMLAKLGKSADADDGVFPFEGFYKKQNKLQRCAMFSSVVVSAFLLLSRLVFDVFVAGPPVNELDLLWIVLAYLGDIVCGVVCYLIIILLLILLHSRHKKLKAKYDE